jgi:hypothetical protein
MSLAYLAQPDQQPTVEWLDGGEFAVLLDAAPPTVSWGRPFRVSQGEAPRSHKGLDEDEVVMLISGTALLWSDEQQMALSQNGIVFLPKPGSARLPHHLADSGPAHVVHARRVRGHVAAGRQAGDLTPHATLRTGPGRADQGVGRLRQVVMGPPR